MKTALPLTLAAALTLAAGPALGDGERYFPPPPVTDPFPQPPGVPAKLLEEVMSGRHLMFRAELPLSFEITATVKTPAHTFDFPDGGALITEAVDTTVTQHCSYGPLRPNCKLIIPAHRERVPETGSSWRTEFIFHLWHWDGRERQRSGRAWGDAPSTPKILFQSGNRAASSTKGFAELFNWKRLESPDIEWRKNIYDEDAPNRFVVPWETLARGVTLTLVRTPDADGDAFTGTIHLKARVAPYKGPGG